MDRRRSFWKIEFLDKLIIPFGKYGYLIVGSFFLIISGIFIFVAIFYHNFVSGVVALCIMFVSGYCWNKDTERIVNGKN